MKFHSNDSEGVRVIELSTSCVKVSLKYVDDVCTYLFYAESFLSGRAYIGEVLIQSWLKSTRK